MAQPQNLADRKVKTFKVTDEFERRHEIFWELRCENYRHEKFASSSRIKSGEVSRCDCQVIEARKKRQFEFNESEAVALLLEYRRTNDEWIFAAFIKLVDPLSEIILNKRGLHDRTDRDELMNSIRLKIWKGLRLWDASRGSKLYSWLQCLIGRMAIQAWHKAYDQPMTESLDALDEEGRPSSGTMELNQISIAVWQNENSTISAPAIEDQEDIPIPDNEKAAVKWLLDTLSPDTAAQASRVYIASLQNKFGLAPERSRAIFWLRS